MKRLKITSVLLSAAMCMSLIATPVSVLADETAAPSESQSTEAAETKEPEATKKKVKETEKKETEPSKVDEAKPSEEKEIKPTDESVSETFKETESQKSTDSEKETTVETKKQMPEQTEKSVDPTKTSEQTVPSETEESVKPTAPSSDPEPSESAKTGEATSPSDASVPSESSIPTDAAPEKEVKKAPKDSHSGKVGKNNLDWVLEDDGTLIISGNGALSVEYLINYSWPWHSYSDQVKKLVIQEGVTSIGWYAFHDLEYLESVSFPSTLKVIEYNAFENDISLKSITFPSGLVRIGDEAFSGCVKLSTVTIPENVDFNYSYNNRQFSGCTGLTSVIIAEGVSDICTEMFSGCTSIKTITWPLSLKWIWESSFSGCTSLTDIYYGGTQEDWNDFVSVDDGNAPLNSAKKHYSPAPKSGKCGDNLTWEFSDNTLKISGSGDMYDYEYWWSENKPDTKPWRYYKNDIKSVTFSGNVTSIGDFAFCKCNNLTSVTIPTSVTTIGAFAFDSCKNLTSIIIPNSVTKIGEGAFEYSAVNKIVIPDSVTELGHAAFYRCSDLSSVTISKSLDTIEYCMFQYCKSLKSIDVPNGVTSIESYAFSDCTNLTSISFPNSLTQIEGYAFSSCINLTSITIPNNVTDIWHFAFAYCTGLTSVTISKSVKEIGVKAFYGCTGLTSITLPGSVVKIEEKAFYNASLKTVTFEGTKAEWEKIVVEDNSEYEYDPITDDYVLVKEELILMKDAFDKVFQNVTLIFDICGKIGHDIAHCDAKSPTETSTGYDEHYECKNCGKVFLDSEGKNETTIEAITLCLITVSSVSNGTATADKTIAHVGEEITLTVNPDEGYEVTTIKVNGSNITGTKFTVPAENVKVEVVISKIKVDNTLNVTGKTAKVKYKKLRKKKQTVSRAKMMTVSGAQGSLTYKIVSVNKKKTSFKINATTGAVTVKKKLKKGTYTLKVSVTAAGNENYKPATKTVSFKIKVK